MDENNAINKFRNGWLESAEGVSSSVNARLIGLSAEKIGFRNIAQPNFIFKIKQGE